MGKRLRKNKTDKSKRFIDLPFAPSREIMAAGERRGAEYNQSSGAEYKKTGPWGGAVKTAAKVEKAGLARAPLDNRRPVLLVGTLEVGDRVARFEMPDAGSDFIDQVLIVADQECGPLITL
jgi:hypothetical protein